MKLEQQVCNLELAQRLKELGVNQKSYFVWAKMWGENSMGDRTTFNEIVATESTSANDYLEETLYSAFTVAELGEMLPLEINFPFKNGKPRSHKHNLRFGTYGNVQNRFYCGYRQLSARENPYERANTEAEARAKMLIYLLENKLITLP